MMRPIFYVEDGKGSYDIGMAKEKISSNNYSWNELTTGFAKKKIERNSVTDNNIYKLKDLYDAPNLEALKGSQACIEYIDTAEEETALIAFLEDDLAKKPYTNVEIHPSLILGVMGNLLISKRQLPRDLFACGQMRQAVSLYHSNFQTKIDKMGVVLNYGQIPLVKSDILTKLAVSNILMVKM